MPDIDIDFEDTEEKKFSTVRTRKVWSISRIGHRHFGHLLARAVARDVGRIIGFDEKR